MVGTLSHFTAQPAEAVLSDKDFTAVLVNLGFFEGGVLFGFKNEADFGAGDTVTIILPTGFDLSASSVEDEANYQVGDGGSPNNDPAPTLAVVSGQTLTLTAPAGLDNSSPDDGSSEVMEQGDVIFVRVKETAGIVAPPVTKNIRVELFTSTDPPHTLSLSMLITT